MRNALLSVLMAFLGVGSSLTAQDRPAVSSDSDPSQPALQKQLSLLAERYIAAYKEKDVDGMMAQWSSQSPSRTWHRYAIEQLFAANHSILLQLIQPKGPEMLSDGKARMRVTVEMSTADAATSQAASLGREVLLLDFVKEGDAWKLGETDAAAELVAALLVAMSEPERARLLKEKPDLVTSNVVKALIWRGKSARRFASNLRTAIDNFLLAQRIAEQIGDRTDLASAYRNLFLSYNTLGDMARARDYSQKGLDIGIELGDQESIAISSIQVGVVADRSGDYIAALESYRKSLSAAESIGDHTYIASALSCIGLVLSNQGKFDEAENYLQRALAHYKEGGADTDLVARSLLNLGVVALERANNIQAMEYFQQALTMGNSKDNQLDPELSGVLLADMGVVFEFQDDDRQALDYLGRGLELSRQIGAKSKMSVALENIGRLDKNQGHYVAALKQYREALRLASEAGEKLRMASLLTDIGEVYELQGQYRAALDALFQGMQLSAHGGYQRELAQSYNFIALVYLHESRAEEAVTFAERASQVAGKSGDREAFFRARTTAARAYRELGQMEKARLALQEAIDTVETLRGDAAGTVTHRQRFFEKRSIPYKEMADLLASQGRASEALAFAERAKGRVLLDVLQRGKIRPRKAMTDSERQQEQELETEQVSLNSQIQRGEGESKPDKQRLDSLKAKLEQARIRDDQFQIALYAAHPELKTERGQASPISLEQTAELLRDDGAALLEFSVGEKRSYLFVVTRKNGSPTPQMRVYPLHAGAPDLAKKAEEFRQTLAARAPDFQVLGKQLYQLLLAPAQRQLAGKHMLIVVPDGALWNLPFQALIQGNGRYVVEQYAVAYAPSLTVLREIERAHKNNDPAKETSQAPTLLAMADPVLGQPTLAHASFAYRGEKLGPLPDARREVQSLKQFYPGPESEIDVGQEAREDRFKVEAGKFRIVHLASHAVLDNANPMYSNILLSPGDSGNEDGLLEAREIMEMDLHANLVVLSACETARGHIAPGEGVIGLNWAFFLAGTPTMVVSQWRVESSSTAALMLSFHRSLNPALGSGMAEVSVARALQKAEIQTLRKPGYAHPFYWAGFVVMGDPRLMTTR